MNPRISDLTGLVFGRLTVTEMTRSRIDGTIRWRCRCVCGETTLVHPVSLKAGVTKSCGCLATEVRRKANAEKKHHGKS